jgi:isopentenyl phosphate kinase
MQGIRPPPLLKIGGSVVTRRGSPCVVDDVNLRRIARAVAASAVRPAVITHGLGTFGRAVMPLYDGLRIPAGRSHLARRVRVVLGELGDRVVDHLDDAGLPVSPLDAGTLFAVSGPTIVATATDILCRHIEAGRIPVLHGGTFLDLHGDHVVVSSDAMMTALAAAVGTDRAVWATDVDGVLDATGQVMATVARTDRGRLWRPAGVAVDPGHAMHGKLESCFQLADAGVTSLIVNGAVDGRLQSALEAATDLVGSRVPAVPQNHAPARAPAQEKSTSQRIAL